jgi:hypothetical protein
MILLTRVEQNGIERCHATTVWWVDRPWRLSGRCFRTVVCPPRRSVDG